MSALVHQPFDDESRLTGNPDPEDLADAQSEMDELTELFGPQATIVLGLKTKESE